ncbi:hypothetical protein RSJ21_15235 [Clostridium botulinum]|uniref:hypothetical protein n=1 Tax=Clostridium botulinum TaxID=1491 RepID=UPI000C75F88C|nr:hypothetical protein [Clostridium botulinum]AUN26511.1 hypothetical protein RSJ21_15130 [Clostridium botulinum]AUN26531.1 hypothetical protein RSJ21_15235 [Clostridium botulinum]
MSEKRKCVFCGGTKLSKEHIFAQWLLKELDIYDNNVSMTHASFIGIPVSNRNHPFSKLVNGLVCEKCNNGWMSQLEEDCQKHIINFMNMNEIESELNFLKEYYDTVAKWAFKNAILLNNATNYRQLVPKEHYVALYSGSIPEGVYIDLAFCKSESKIEWRQTLGGLVVKNEEIPLNPNVTRYQITFQIKMLLIKVTFYKSSVNVFYEDEGVIRLFPQFGAYGTPKLFDNIDDFDIHGVIHEYRDINK